MLSTSVRGIQQIIEDVAAVDFIGIKLTVERDDVRAEPAVNGQLDPDEINGGDIFDNLLNALH